MAKEKKTRDKRAEKALKARLANTHLKSYKILGSEVNDGISTVYVLRIVGADNYLFKVNCTGKAGGNYEMSGLIPVNGVENIGEYRVYNPKVACADVLRPTAAEKKFKGYA